MVRELLKTALKSLPGGEEQRRERLANLWSPSDADRAQKLEDDFGAITSREVREGLIVRLGQKS
jgi:cell wall assembly regulator SMI1